MAILITCPNIHNRVSLVSDMVKETTNPFETIQIFEQMLEFVLCDKLIIIYQTHISTQC